MVPWYDGGLATPYGGFPATLPPRHPAISSPPGRQGVHHAISECAIVHQTTPAVAAEFAKLAPKPIAHFAIICTSDYVCTSGTKQAAQSENRVTGTLAK